MKKRIIKILECFIFIFLGIMLWEKYLGEISNLPDQSTVSYYRVLNILIQQLNGEVPLETIYGNMHGAVYPIFLAYLANFFHIMDSGEIVYYVQGLAVVGSIMFCGGVIWYWRKKFWMGIVTVLGIWELSKAFLVYDITYSYWGAGVVVLAALPLLCDLFTNIRAERKKKNLLELLLITIIMIIGNIMRQYAALPVMVLELLYLCLKIMRSTNVKSRIALVFGTLVMLLLFFGTEPFIHSMYDTFSGKLKIENVEKPWHAIWCGLGYVENDYGFQWFDGAAMEYVASVDATVQYCSEEYFDILKSRIMEVIVKDPLYVLAVLYKKFIDSLKIGFSVFGRMFLVAFLLWLISCILSHKKKKNKQKTGWGIALGGAMVILGTVQCVVGIPHARYMYASYAGYCYLIIYLLIEFTNNCCIAVKSVCEEKKEDSQTEGRLLRKRSVKNKILYIIVPCYNEEENLGGGYTFDRLEVFIKKLIREEMCSPKSRILMINDGSTDKTAELLEKKHMENPLFSYIHLSRNFGHQYALLCGLMEARKFADFTITIDADLQQDITAMKDFIERYSDGYEIVYGVRESRESDGWFKKWSANFYYDIMKNIFGCNIVKNHADYRLMSQKALDALAEYGETNLFLRGLIPMLGFQSCIVYFSVSKREFGESKYTLKKMSQLAIDGITSLSTRLIRLVFFAGISIFLVSCVISLAYFMAYLRGQTVSGWTSLVMSIWMLGGLIMMSIGCVGEYIGKLYFEAKRRPRYIIDSFENDEDYEYKGEQENG